jgi:hypothetical protein
VCACEFDAEDLIKSSASKINSSKFKICQSCIDKSDPTDDYKQAREIVNTYLGWSKAKILLNEAKSIIYNIKK